MSENIHAIYHDGAFHPLEPVSLPDGTHANVTPLPVAPTAPESPNGPATKWPDSYFEQTSGALAGEDFVRPPQPDLPARDNW